MYKVIETALSVETKNGSKYHPLVTLADEYGGLSHIVCDDHCYVLINGSLERGFETVKHWYLEAAKALSNLIYTTKEALKSQDVISVCHKCVEAGVKELNESVLVYEEDGDGNISKAYCQKCGYEYIL